MLRVGLTGGIACGKSTVAELFASYGVPIVDADVIAREVVEPGSEALSELVAFLGEKILTTDGALDRKAVRKLIFSDPSAKLRVEEILHPRIRQQMALATQKFEQSDARYCINVIPLLLETNQHTSVDRVLVVDCDKEEQIRRIVHRDMCSEDEAKEIINAQISRNERIAAADDIINNSISFDSLKQAVKRLHGSYLDIAQTAS